MNRDTLLYTAHDRIARCAVSAAPGYVCIQERATDVTRTFNDCNFYIPPRKIPFQCVYASFIYKSLV